MYQTDLMETEWQLVYYYYRKWASLSDFDLLLDKLRGHVRVKRGQNMEPSAGIMNGLWKGHSRKWITIEDYAEIMN